MTLYQTMRPQMLSELMPFIIEKIFATWTRVQAASSSTMTPGLRIPTRSRSHPQTQKFMGSAVQSMYQTTIDNSPILICPDMTDNVLSQGLLAKINKSIMTTLNSIDNTYLSHSLWKYNIPY